MNTLTALPSWAPITATVLALLVVVYVVIRWENGRNRRKNFRALGPVPGTADLRWTLSRSYPSPMVHVEQEHKPGKWRIVATAAVSRDSSLPKGVDKAKHEALQAFREAAIRADMRRREKDLEQAESLARRTEVKEYFDATPSAPGPSRRNRT